MSRFEGDIAASASSELDGQELLASLGVQGGAGDRQRQRAITCVLSASEGWREAARALGGAFAADGRPRRSKDAE